MQEDTEYIVIGGLQEHQSVKTDGICTTLTSAMGQGGGYVPLIVTIERVDDEKDSNL